MRLDRLLDAVDVFDRPVDAQRIDVTSVTDDTREVIPGAVFCCIAGEHTDGHNLVAQAVARGAVAIITQRELPEVIDVPQVRVDNTRAAIAAIAATFYDRPSRHVKVIGITGTNGKTTTAHVLMHILKEHHWKTATIGTLNGHYTTPPAHKLQKMLAEFRRDGYQAVVMEVSSHALVQHRADGVRFAVGVFTNLTQDHLDYHRTMSRYFEAKSMLFDPGRCERAAINVGDEWGRQLLDRIAVRLDPFSLSDVKDLVVGPEGSTFKWHDQEISLPLVGRFNVENALAAATAARCLNVPVQTIAHALGTVPSVPGRLERVDRGQPFTVFVDFAHTPDGLQNVLQVARTAADQREGRVLVVFGCGGDRDRSKRPQMAAIAEQLADQIVLTSDNPRSEDPAVIVQDALAGMASPDKAHVELDRREAIGQAIAHAKPGDVVLIAGKGHEATQEIGGVKHPFDDRLVAIEALERGVR